MQRLASDPRWVQTFVWAVELGSFSALARAWNVKPSSISRQIAALEDELGVRLLARTTRKLSPTEAGHRLYERARGLLSELDGALRDAAELTESPRGLLRVSGPIAFGQRYLAPLLGAFKEAYPDIDLEIGLHDRFVDLVGEGWDAAIRAGHVRDESLVARRLAPNDRVLVAARGYLARRGRPEQPEDLAHHDALLFRYVDADDRWRFRRRDAELRVVVSGPVASNSGELLIQAAEAGLGVALLPRWLAFDALQAGRVEQVLANWEVTATDFDSPLSLLYPSRRWLPAKVRALVDFLSKAFTPAPWIETASSEA